VTTRRRLPNIVYILADDLGYGDVSCQNEASRIRTPHADRLATQGMRFTDAHSGSAVCTPTRYGVLTGRYCWRTSLTQGVLQGFSAPLIDPGSLTVPALLKRHGYATACIGKWHLGLGWQRIPGAPAAPEGAPPGTFGDDVDFTRPLALGPTQLGFDTYFGISASLDMPPYTFIEDDRVCALPTERLEPSRRPLAWRGGPLAPGFTFEGVMPRLTRRAQEYIAGRRAAPEQPFFLYFATTSPHLPLVPNAAFRGASDAGLYGDFVVEWDDAVGQVLAALDEHGFGDDTLVIVTSDNGAELGSGQADFGHRSNGPWRGQKADVWDGGHRIPFLARWPGVVPAGSVCGQTTCLTDLLATCADVVGATLPGQDGPDSVSILPALRGERSAPSDPPLREATVHHAFDGMFAVRQGPWKLVLGHGSGGFTRPRREDPGPGAPPGRLHHLGDDPAEATDYWTERPDVVATLSALLERYRREGHSRPAAAGTGQG
jgi:arylsulfatase A-like enzyme